MTAKEYLNSIRDLDRQIDIKLEQAMRCRSQAERITSTLNPNRGSGRTVRDASGGIDKLIDLEREINVMVDELVERKRAAMEAIAAVQDEDERAVLEMRYLNRMRWQDIAKKVPCDRRTVYNLHGRALLRLTVPDQDTPQFPI